MSLSSYSDLIARIPVLTTRDDLTTDQVADYVRGAETDVSAKLRVRQMICRASAQVTGEFVPLPTNFCGIKALTLVTTDPVTPLKFIDAADLRDKKAMSSAAGRPRYYSIVGDVLQLFPQPDTTYTAEMLVYESLPSLKAHGSNWLLDRYPLAYLYGALVQFALEYTDHPDGPKWKQMYDETLQSIRNADAFEHHSNRPTQRLRRFG